MSSTDVQICRNGHCVPDVRVSCPECGEFVLLTRGYGQERRHRLGVPLAVLILSALWGAVLFRLSGTIWPAYAVVALSLVHLWLVVYSRGAALGMVSVVTLVTLVGWSVALATVDQDVVGSGPGRWFPVALWLLATGYALLASRRSLPAVRARGGYSATMMTFVLGLWLVIALDLDWGLGYQEWLQFLVLAVAAAPLVFVLVLLGRDGNRPVGGYLVAISAYLAVAHHVVRMLAAAFTRLLPDLLGLDRPEPLDPAWLRLLDWRAAVSAVAAAAALLYVLINSVTTVAREFRATDQPFLTAQLAASAESLARTRDSVARTAQVTYQLVLNASRVIYLVATFVTRTIVEGVRMVLQLGWELLIATLNTLRFLLAPVLGFSVVAVLLLAALRDLYAYSQGAEVPFGAWELWGGLVCAGALVMVVIGSALGFAPLMSGPATDGSAPVRPRRASFNGLFPALLLLSTFWVFFSVVSVALWLVRYALDGVGIGFRAVAFGPLLTANLVVTIGFVLLLMGLVLATGGLDRGGVQPSRNSLVLWSLLVAVAAFTVLAVVLGLDLLRSWLGEFG